MMGLQVAANKRRYEMSTYSDGEIHTNCSPPKIYRWSTASSTTTTTPIISSNTQSTINNRTIVTSSLTTTVSSPSLTSPQSITSLENSIAKLEAVVVPGETWSPSEPIVDSIQRLQAVVVPGERWAGERTTLATTLLAADDLDDDDDDFEDDFEEEDSPVTNYSPVRYPCSPPRGYIPPGYSKHFGYYKDSYSQQNCSKPSYFNRSGSPHYNNWNHYYNPPEAASPQQTIRCAENGKSYLELGSASYGPSNMNLRNHRRCCDGKNNWCNTKQCYKERRLKMMNLSMFKLSRFRQISEQSLYRSVLICNTLKLIEKEMEMENKENSMAISTANTATTNETNLSKINNPNYCIRINGTNNINGNSSENTSSQDIFSNIRPTTPAQTFNNNNSELQSQTTSPYENQHHHPFRDAGSGRATPFPMLGLPDTDSGYGDEDCTRPINWGSVLSLSSQSALDPLNNNDLFASLSSCNSVTNTATSYWDYNIFESDLGLDTSDLTELLPSWKLTPLSADDILKSVPPPMEPSKIMHDNEIDTFTHIMVGS